MDSEPLAYVNPKCKRQIWFAETLSIDTSEVIGDKTITEPHEPMTLSRDLALDTFLSRPVLVHTGQWSEGLTMSPIVIDVFKLLIATPSIKAKLTGYKYFRAGMKMTVTCSSSPFLYGLAHASYVPLDDGAFGAYGEPIRPPVAYDDLLGLLQRSTCPQSGWLLPQENTSLTFEVPFLLPIEWYDLTSPPTTMGSLIISNPVTLRTAGTAGAAVVDISVVANFFDVELCGPTVLAPQSHTMSALSSDLNKVGLSGPGTWASVASKALKLVGLSNEPVLPVSNVAPKILFGLTNSDIDVSSEPLSAGKEIRLLSDPTPESEDELDIAQLCVKPTYIELLSWTPSTAVNSAVGTVFCAPHHFNFTQTLGPASNTYYDCILTPPAYVGTMFNFWRGTMVYRFKVICSQFHRGKLRFYYDSDNIASHPPEGLAASQVLDLASDTEMIIRVPMNSKTPWLHTSPYFAFKTNSPLLKTIGNPPGATYSSNRFSGSIRVEVIQRLTSPALTGSVQVLVESWLEDAQFADPCRLEQSAFGRLHTQTPYYWQSAEYEPCLPDVGDPPPRPTQILEPQSANIDSGLDKVAEMPNGVSTAGRALGYYFGEDIRSLRVILHRSMYYRDLLRTPSTVLTKNILSPVTVIHTIPRAPRTPYYETDANLQAASNKVATTTALGDSFNYVVTSNFSHLVRLFQGYKGSFRWSANAAGYDAKDYPARIAIARSRYAVSQVVIGTVDGSPSQTAYAGCLATGETNQGRAVSNMDFNNVTVDVHDPTTVAFLPANTGAPYSTFVTSVAPMIEPNDNIAISVEFQPTSATNQSTPTTAVKLFVGACPNMRFKYFKCVPMVYLTRVNNLPTPSTTL